ncbi:MAG TPA: YbaB/EbfC family nucleoid-associated protein [Thermoguttaceae bacterium]|nr:YbaB/EbfC family nucleoid-associated protein [Thermoguttaceae bacterium]
MFKKLSNLASMLKQAQQLGGQLQNLSEELRERRATGTGGAGMVEIEINGVLEVLRCRIDEQLIAGGDRELIEDLVVAAVNQAILKGKQLHAEAMKELTGGLELPGLQEVLDKVTGPEPSDAPEEEKSEES